ncbi:MAG: Gp49 family protein [Moraxella sp.]|nr:Gp49 family protein [Moraxella sp.]
MKSITKEFLESEIVSVEYQRGQGTLTHCYITVKNGFTFTGESACVDEASFDKEIGEKFAYENAFEKMWHPYGFWLKQSLNDVLPVGVEVLPDGAEFDFGLAINLLKDGKKVARKGWNGKGMYLLLATGIDFETKADLSDMQNENGELTVPSITMKTADNKFVVGWLASQTDMLAEDWVVVQ